MAYLFGISLLCLILATRVSGVLRLMLLGVAAPLFIAGIGSVLQREFTFSVEGAIALASIALVALIGLPLFVLYLQSRRAKAREAERRARLRALEDHLRD